VARTARTPEVFSSAQGIAIPDLHFDSRLLPIETDPPAHREFRRLLNPFVTREHIARCESMICATAAELLDVLRTQLAESPEIDFVSAFARLFPGRIALKFMGFPPADTLRLDSLINTTVDGRGTPAAAQAGAELNAYIDEFLAARRALPCDPLDLVSVVAYARIDDVSLTSEQQNSLTKLLLFGGFTTTTFALASAFRWLADHPADRSRLREEPALLATAIDEFVRFSSPGTYLGRMVVAETQLGTTALHPNDRVLLSYGSANRDPAVFERADEVVLERTPNRHMGFGHANHSCLGVHLARLEMRIAFQTLLPHLIEFEVDRSRPIEWSSGETQGMTTLPLIVHRMS
jgi:cytochrome P450